MTGEPRPQRQVERGPLPRSREKEFRDSTKATTRRVRRSGFSRVPHRLLPYGATSVAVWMCLDARMTAQQAATAIGVTRSWVNRLLARMRSDGLVDADGGLLPTVPFVKAPYGLLAIPRGVAHTWLCLASFRDCPLVDGLAQRMGCSRATAFRRLSEAESEGVIMRQQVLTGYGQAASEYAIRDIEQDVPRHLFETLDGTQVRLWRVPSETPIYKTGKTSKTPLKGVPAPAGAGEERDMPNWRDELGENLAPDEDDKPTRERVRDTTPTSARDSMRAVTEIAAREGLHVLALPPTRELAMIIARWRKRLGTNCAMEIHAFEQALLDKSIRSSNNPRQNLAAYHKRLAAVSRNGIPKPSQEERPSFLRTGTDAPVQERPGGFMESMRKAGG